MPAFVSLLPNINDFTRFADGGDDSNWYIGFNNAWIVKLPSAPDGSFARAFIGAKIGRAKTKPNANKPWLRERLDGKIYIAISQTPSFSAQQSFFLVQTGDLPLEPDPQATLTGIGAASWFWAEVPLSLVSFTTPNYLIVYSPTDTFVKAANAPILAGATDDSGDSEPRAWNNHSISGVPPRNPDSALETPLSTLSPAIAIKLSPPNSSEISISEFALSRVGQKCVASFSAWGENIVEGWVERSRDGLDWERIVRPRQTQPFIFTLRNDRCPPPGEFIRGAVRDLLGTVAAGEARQVP
ncbi:MAG: hypothetical protein PHF00_00490 [Elusimicrobia bacterium]|nr:hypothetical protein [Elusimicrobiota bacterium]